MKKAVTILLLILLVSIQTPVGQLFKLPLLIEHYIKHQQQEDITLIGFLEVHYTTDHKDADLPEDEQLPFKNIISYSIGNAIVTPIVQANMISSLPNEKEIILPDTYFPQQHLGSIFHPPRI